MFLRARVYLKRCAVSSLAIMRVYPLSLLPAVLCVRFLAVRDSKTRQAWQQQQANANAVAEAALQAQQKEMTRRPGDYKGGSRNAKYYSAVVLCTVLKFKVAGLRLCLFVCLKKNPPVMVKMSKFQHRSSSLQCTYATLVWLHSRQRCCSRGRKDGY